jgi:hypothetical protein
MYELGFLKDVGQNSKHDLLVVEQMRLGELVFFFFCKMLHIRQVNGKVFHLAMVHRFFGDSFM